jgi:hypothetical protein
MFINKKENIKIGVISLIIIFIMIMIINSCIITSSHTIPDRTPPNIITTELGFTQNATYTLIVLLLEIKDLRSDILNINVKGSIQSNNKEYVEIYNTDINDINNKEYNTVLSWQADNSLFEIGDNYLKFNIIASDINNNISSEFISNIINIIN